MMFKTEDVLPESFLHLLLWPIFRQSHPNFIDVRPTYASEIWTQLTKNLLTKSSTGRFRENIEELLEERLKMKVVILAGGFGNQDQRRKPFKTKANDRDR